MAKIPQSAKDLIETFPLGFVATVNKDGHPNLSPKGTFMVLEDDVIAFAEIRSPNTMTNLANEAHVEVNFIDIWKRKGVRIFGPATVVEKETEAFDILLPTWATPFPTLAPRINAIVLIQAQRVNPVTTPPYDDGATEQEMIATYTAKFAEIYS